VVIGTEPTAISRATLLTLVICVLGNMTDGLDILAVSFVGSAIAHDWALDSAALGFLFSAGLVGVAIGSLTVSPFSDRFGRRPVALACLSVMTLGMAGCAVTPSLALMVACLLLTGLGIGGLLPTLNSVVAETAPPHRRNLAIGLFSMGYPLGSTIGGLSAVWLLSSHGWKAIFLVAALFTALVLVMGFFFLPESGVARAGNDRRATGYGAHFSSQRRALTGLICAAFFLNMLSFFFILIWTPRLTEALGLDAATGAKASVILNTGSLLGGLAYGTLADWIGWNRMTQLCFCLFAAAVALFSALPGQALVVFACAAVTGVVMSGCMTSLYSLSPLIFPREIRAGGTGLAIGIGRIGGAIGPGLAGLGLAEGVGRTGLYLLFTLPPLLVVLTIRHLAASRQFVQSA
jgi:MFS family permease